MGKKKLQRFEELRTLERVFQPEGMFLDRVYELRGNWNKKVFNNNQPLILELGCGKGEYTVGLAKRNPQNNYIGVDIKGARIWRGAKTINDENILNAAFLRTHIDQLAAFFDTNEIAEIWITFPDPQPQLSRTRKRLTSPKFLTIYKRLLAPGGVIHLKTDNRPLYEYTLEVIKAEGLELISHSDDIYSDHKEGVLTEVQTTYEKRFLAQGLSIHHIAFGLNTQQA